MDITQSCNAIAIINNQIFARLGLLKVYIEKELAATSNPRICENYVIADKKIDNIIKLYSHSAFDKKEIIETLLLNVFSNLQGGMQQALTSNAPLENITTAMAELNTILVSLSEIDRIKKNFIMPFAKHYMSGSQLWGFFDIPRTITENYLGAVSCKL